MSNSNPSGAELQRTSREHTWLPPLPRRLAHLEPVYLAAADGLLADKGGLEAVTTAELMLITDTVEAFVVGRMIGRRIFRRGVTRKVRVNGQPPREELAPAIAAYFTAKNTVRLGLMALGLERRAKGLSLSDYLEGRRGEDEAHQDGRSDANDREDGSSPEGGSESGTVADVDAGGADTERGTRT